MPKTKEQFEQIKKERMEKILSASLYLFATKGYNAVTTDEITNYVGCSHGLLYHYFGSKEDLFSALLETKVKRIIREIADGIDFNASPKFVLIDLVNATLSSLKSSNDEYACAIYLLLNLHLQRKDIPKPKSKEKKGSLFDFLYELIEKGKREGKFYNYNTKEMVISLYAIFKGLSYSRIYIGSQRFTCPNSEIITKMIIKE